MLINIAQKKDFDALNATHRTSALCEVPFLKNQEKKQLKMDIFDHFDHFYTFFLFVLFFFIFIFFIQNWYVAESSDFLPWIQCIKPLLLSYLNQHFKNFSNCSSKGETLMILGWSKVTRCKMVIKVPKKI